MNKNLLTLGMISVFLIGLFAISKSSLIIATIALVLMVSIALTVFQESMDRRKGKKETKHG